MPVSYTHLDVYKRQVLRHGNPQQVIEVLIVGNALGLLSTLYRIDAPLRAPVPAPRASRVAR